MGNCITQKGEDFADLFSIGQATAVTGLSRSTILRLEDRGLLKPAYINSDSGRRYYDNYNISRILEVQRFQAMGFNTEETAFYFDSHGEADDLVAMVEKKLHDLQWTYDEIRLRAKAECHQSVQLTQLAAEDYYVERFRGLSMQEKYDAAYNAFHHCVEKGYLLGPRPLMIVNYSTDYLEGRIPDAPFDFDACIPIQAGQASPETVHFPACTALMLFYCGDFQDIAAAHLHLGQLVREHHLTPAGYIRAIGVVGPYVGRELSAAKYRSRLILPIEKPNSNCGLKWTEWEE